MDIRTIKGALLIAKRTIKKVYNEKVVQENILGSEDGIVITEFSIFLVHYVKKIDRRFSETFPEISNQILWNEGIKIDKRTVLQFSRMSNNKNRKLSVLFILSDGTVFQISPLSLISFCEAMNLEIGRKGIYYFFPTILLTRLNGKPSDGEILTKKKLSVIAQINELENIEEPDFSSSSFSLRDFDSDIVSEIVQVLKSINEHLSNIEKKLYGRKKQ
jgi:hypothetical protein